MSININAMNKVLSKYLGCICFMTDYNITVDTKEQVEIIVSFISKTHPPVLCKDERFRFNSFEICYNFFDGTTEYRGVKLEDDKLKKKLLKAFRQESWK